MRRGTALVVVVGGTMALAAGLPRLAEALGSLEAFRVAEVRVEGNDYLSEDDVVEAAAVPPDASVWDDPTSVAERLRAHPGVREARVARRLPRALVLEVFESEPVALFPDPVLTPVDGEGRLLPMDPTAHRLDLPIVRPGIRGTSSRLTTGELRDLVSELRSLGELSPDLLASVSDVVLDDGGDVLLALIEPRVVLHYRPPMGSPPMGARRLEEGLAALDDALDRDPDRQPVAVDLRFEDQVVVRLAPQEDG